jgi:hypothetical protein
MLWGRSREAKWDWRQINGTHQLPIYVDDINLQEDNINTTKKNTDTLKHCSTPEQHPTRATPVRTLSAQRVQTILEIYMQVWIRGLDTFCRFTTLQRCFCTSTLKCNNQICYLYFMLYIFLSILLPPAWRHVTKTTYIYHHNILAMMSEEFSSAVDCPR